MKGGEGIWAAVQGAGEGEPNLSGEGISIISHSWGTGPLGTVIQQRIKVS